MISPVADPFVYFVDAPSYDAASLAASLPSLLFEVITPADTVVLKPNWVKESHLRKHKEWEQVITHPAVITAVLGKVCARLGPGARVIIADGPQTDSSFEKIIARYPVEEWKEMTSERGIILEILDLRDDEWIQEDDVVVNRRKLPGDPRGKSEFNLEDGASEFFGHRKSERGYYGADYNIRETNEAHDGHRNLYRISRSVLEADVFINLPKLKTHKKAGITCCLKNLVGINAYKNFLPHHSEGGPAESGDQFPADNARNRIEGPLLAFAKQHLLHHPLAARMLKPLGRSARSLFGITEEVVRSGNWYGNDTLWRMVLDLNKILLYGNRDGTMRDMSPVHAKRYIGIVDAVIAGEGNGPLAPDPKPVGRLIAGTNPVAIDAASAWIMGFDPLKIPVISHAFGIREYPLCQFRINEIAVIINNSPVLLPDLPGHLRLPCLPHFGWKGHIEDSNPVS